MSTPATPPIDYAATMRAYDAWEAACAKLVPENKKRLFACLASAPITRVVVLFDGEGDSDQIEDIQAYNGDAQVDLPKGKVDLLRLPYKAKKAKPRKLAPAEALETLAYDFLREKHDGWENSDGAYGKFVFDVAAGTVTLDFNERFMSSEQFQYSW